MADGSTPYPGPNEFSATEEKAMRAARAQSFISANTPPGASDSYLAQQDPPSGGKAPDDAIDEQ